MAKIAHGHFRHMIAATRYSLSGLAAAFREELAFRQICFCCFVGVPFAFLVGGDWLETMLLIFPLALAVIVELLNTAVESVVDSISTELHPLSKKAKDTASAAQFCAQILIVGAWGSFFIRKLF